MLLYFIYAILCIENIKNRVLCFISAAIVILVLFLIVRSVILGITSSILPFKRFLLVAVVVVLFWSIIKENA